MKMKQFYNTYNDNSQEMLKFIKTRPLYAINLILERMRPRRKGMIQHKIEQNKHWKEICEKNFYKSLDHRSFYFNQNERKNTNSKAFLAEIKKRYEERVLISTSLMVKKGGSENSIYYNSSTMLAPEPFHKIPIEEDEINQLSER
jgi:paired amphipathic helix protein Sin3a